MPITADHPLINCQPYHPSLTERVSDTANSVLHTLQTWGARIHERHTFPVIDDRELRDLGLSRWELDRELRKPFWRD